MGSRGRGRVAVTLARAAVRITAASRTLSGAHPRRRPSVGAGELVSDASSADSNVGGGRRTERW